MEKSPITDLATVEAPANSVVLFDSDKFDAFCAKLKADIDAVPVDLTTKKGRDAIASAAAKVRSEKASIDRDRKKLTQEWRDMTAQVNGAWKGIETRLDDLAVSARKPLTEWEEAEKARLDRCNDIISEIHGAAIVTMEDTSETVRDRGMKVWAIEIGEDFGSLAHDAEQAKSATVSTLQAALARLKQEEADKAELAKLREEAEKRAEADRIAEEAAEAKRQDEARKEAERIAAVAAKAEAERQAEMAEKRRVDAEKAEAERIDKAREEAANLAQREAEKAAQQERDRIQREHDAQIFAERAERDRLAAIEANRLAAEKQAADEQAARDADKAHKTAVMKAAKEAIMTCGTDEETARKIVLLIRAGDVPNISLMF